jgi:hypothetical protein
MIAEPSDVGVGVLTTFRGCSTAPLVGGFSYTMGGVENAINNLLHLE